MNLKIMKMDAIAVSKKPLSAKPMIMVMRGLMLDSTLIMEQLQLEILGMMLFYMDKDFDMLVTT